MCEITCGFSVHLIKEKVFPSMLLAPIKYGNPIFSELHSSFVKSLPDNNCPISSTLAKDQFEGTFS